jgi:hypothetical protein
MLAGSSSFLPLKSHPRLAQAFFASKLKLRLEWLRLSELRFEKHALQYTGLPSLGLKGTVAFLPQSSHLISNILFWGV